MGIMTVIENNDSLLLIIAGISVLGFLCSLALVPWVVVRIPADYFSQSHRVPATGKGQPAPLRWLLILLKNLIGLVVSVLGIAMLILPGQGLLTLLIGILLIDFPGKYKLERWIISRRLVFSSVNWLRKRGQKDPLQLQESE